MKELEKTQFDVKIRIFFSLIVFELWIFEILTPISSVYLASLGQYDATSRTYRISYSKNTIY
jgi:hypothetical protein